MAYILANGRQQYFDDSGNPLNGGKLWTMQPGPGVTTPKTTWSDAAATTPNANPIILNARGEATVFWSGTYNVRLETAASQLIYTVESIATGDDGLRADLASTASSHGADLVGWLQTGTGAVATTVDDWMRGRPISVKDFGAVGSGAVNDKPAIDLAIAAAMAGDKRLLFPAGVYDLGNWGTSTRIFDMTTYGDNIDLITEGDVEFVVNLTATCNPVVWYLRGNNHFHAGRMRFRSVGYNRGLQSGALPYTLDAYSANWGNVEIDGIYAKNCHTAFQCATQTTTRVRGIHIKQIYAYQCNRGACFQDQGDDVVIDLLYTEECERAWFGYGVTGHTFNVFTRNNFGTTGVINIMRGVGGYDTSSIDVNYTSRDDTVDLCHVLIDHIDLLGGSITGITVHVDIRGSAAYDPVRIVNYTGSGGSETSGASPNIVGDITLSGSCDAQARDVEVVASYGATRRMNFTSGRYFEMDDSVPQKFSLGGGGLYSPIAADWGAPTPPALGNGTLARTHTIDDGVCNMQYTLTPGNTTTFGTGAWVFYAPIAATAPSVGSAYMIDAGTMNYIGAAVITTGNYTVNIYCDGASTAVGSTVPFTWANGDQLFFSLSYPIS